MQAELLARALWPEILDPQRERRTDPCERLRQPRLFGTVAIPATVADELRHQNAPDAARIWAAELPPWLTMHPDPAEADL
ncbi:MAG: hypothetical protein ACREFZ_00395 [Acetobacteraceae bacterium]